MNLVLWYALDALTTPVSCKLRIIQADFRLRVRINGPPWTSLGQNNYSAGGCGQNEYPYIWTTFWQATNFCQCLVASTNSVHVNVIASTNFALKISGLCSSFQVVQPIDDKEVEM